VHACPAGAPAFPRGALGLEEGANGSREGRFVAVEPYACLECGACRLSSAVAYEHPADGRGVRFDGTRAMDEAR
jgi:hypothetical protein